jgi:hypothetical protein
MHKHDDDQLHAAAMHKHDDDQLHAAAMHKHDDDQLHAAAVHKHDDEQLHAAARYVRGDAGAIEVLAEHGCHDVESAWDAGRCREWCQHDRLARDTEWLGRGGHQSTQRQPLGRA